MLRKHTVQMPVIVVPTTYSMQFDLRVLRRA